MPGPARYRPCPSPTPDTPPTAEYAQKPRSACSTSSALHHLPAIQAARVPAVPARALRALSVALAKLRPVIVQYVVLARHKENFLARRLQNLVHRVELFRLRQVADISGMQQELRRIRQPVDLVHRGLQRPRYIRIRRFVESHVAVADLHEAQ